MKVTMMRVLRAVESGEYVGFCRACGARATGVEPDARHYACAKCKRLEVFGAEELLMMYGF